MAVVRWTAPLPIFATAGQSVSLTSALEASFTAPPSAWTVHWLSYFGEAYMAKYNFGYWPGATKVAHSWLVGGVDVGEIDANNQVTVAAVSAANRSNVQISVGNNIGPLLNMQVPAMTTSAPVTNSIVYTMLVVDPALKMDHVGLRAPTAAEIVQSAQRFDTLYGHIRNPDDCSWVAMALAGAAGATLSSQTQSLVPSENEEGGFWRIAYRGSDPNPSADWTRLVQPGDIVRLGWAPGDGFHMLTVIEKGAAAGQLVVYDNNRPDPGGITLGFHTENNLHNRTHADTITIYRLTADNFYLMNGSAEADALPGTIFNDKSLGLAGDDILSGGAGDDVLIGGLGADRLNGGDGSDAASFGEAASNYEWWQAQDGSWKVKDLRANSPEGTDSLSSVEQLQFSDKTVKIVGLTTAEKLTDAYTNVMRNVASGSELTFLNDLIAAVNGSTKTLSAAIGEIVQKADGTTAVATLSYQFFAGFTPSKGGFDYLVSPQGPNPNNINSAYYQNFSFENRYINFAVNLGKLGEGAAGFLNEYGQLTLFEATKAAYMEIFGGTVTDGKINLILDGDVGNGLTRKDYFAVYGGDGLQGIGTKAAMVGWLLTEAAKADVGMYARSSNAFLADLADGAETLIDLIGVYGTTDYIFNG